MKLKFLVFFICLSFLFFQSLKKPQIADLKTFNRGYASVTNLTCQKMLSQSDLSIGDQIEIEGNKGFFLGFLHSAESVEFLLLVSEETIMSFDAAQVTARSIFQDADTSTYIPKVLEQEGETCAAFAHHNCLLLKVLRSTGMVAVDDFDVDPIMKFAKKFYGESLEPGADRDAFPTREELRKISEAFFEENKIDAKYVKGNAFNVAEELFDHLENKKGVGLIYVNNIDWKVVNRTVISEEANITSTYEIANIVNKPRPVSGGYPHAIVVIGVLKEGKSKNSQKRVIALDSANGDLLILSHENLTGWPQSMASLREEWNGEGQPPLGVYSTMEGFLITD